MTDEQLSAISDRASRATEGPWRTGGDLNTQIIAPYDGYGLGPVAEAVATGRLAETDVQANATFLAHAREDVPALCEEVKRLRGVLREIDAALAKRVWPPQDSSERITAWNEAIDAARTIVVKVTSGRATLPGDAGPDEVTNPKGTLVMACKRCGEKETNVTPGSRHGGCGGAWITQSTE